MKNAICALERTILRITLFSLLSISLSHAMEEKDITPGKKGNLKGSGEYATLSKKKSLEEQGSAFYTEHTKYALKPIFHVLVTGDTPELDEDLMAGKYGKLKGINVDSESAAHAIMQMRMSNFFEDKKNKLFKDAKGPKQFIARGSKFGKKSFHQFFVVKASEHGKNEQEILRIKAFYTSMLTVASSSFSAHAASLAAKANKEYKKTMERKISKLKANTLILKQKHAGDILELNNKIITEQNKTIAEQNAHKSTNKARKAWKTTTIVGGATVIVAGYGAYKAGFINTDKVIQTTSNIKEFLGNNS